MATVQKNTALALHWKPGNLKFLKLTSSKNRNKKKQATGSELTCHQKEVRWNLNWNIALQHLVY